MWTSFLAVVVPRDFVMFALAWALVPSYQQNGAAFAYLGSVCVTASAVLWATQRISRELRARDVPRADSES